MSAESEQVRSLIKSIALKISSSESELDAQAMSNALYGLQVRVIMMVMMVIMITWHYISRTLSSWESSIYFNTITIIIHHTHIILNMINLTIIITIIYLTIIIITIINLTIIIIVITNLAIIIMFIIIAIIYFILGSSDCIEISWENPSL